MAHHVCVKKITVEYAAGGQRFRVDFDPMRIMAIAFSKTEFDRMTLQQRQSGVLKDGDIIHFDGARTLEEEEGGRKPGATSEKVQGDATSSGGPLWWYTDANTWFHPQV